jgi:nitric oxide reductase subunit B
MRYQSQKVAYPYFVLSAILFGLQIAVGLVIAAQYVWPNFLSTLLPFNVGREIHLNTMVFWLLLGLMGATYYLVPDETGEELFSTKLAKFQFWLLALTGVAAVVGFLFGWTEGREYIEAPRFFDWLIVVAALVFLFNILRTILKGKWTVILGVLLGGMAGLSVIYLFGMKFFANVGVDQYFWWFVIHLWVEGTWEMIAAAVLAYMLIKLTGAERKTVEKWLYIETILVMATGILGIGHHYYWIGTPKYWLAIGGFFSFLEPIPLVLMVLDTYREYRKRTIKHPNQVALLWIIGSVIVHFIGAGIMGVVQTLPAINKWTHGTQLTASHGHLAFFGAFAMLVIAASYYMLPDMSGRHEFRQRRGKIAFWSMVIGMGAMSTILFGAGIVQVYLERILGMDYSTVKSQFLHFWMFWRLIAGMLFTFGVGLFIVAFFNLPVSAKPKNYFYNE